MQEKFAFFPPNPPSYDENFKNRALRFIPKRGSSMSSAPPETRIPYMLYLAPSPKGFASVRTSWSHLDREALKTQFTLIFTHGNAEGTPHLAYLPRDEADRDLLSSSAALSP